MSAHTVSIADLDFSYPGSRDVAISIPELHVRAGERIALIGASGAGKSTLLRILDGRVRGWSGVVRILGLALSPTSQPPRSLRCETGFIFQEFALVEQATVLQNVLNGRLGRTDMLASLFGRFSEHDHHEAWQAMRDVDIADMADRRVEKLSGGQRQRVAIARCLAQQPSLILADEPVSNLDPVTAKSILALLAACAKERGATLLMSSHQPGLVREYVDRTIALDGGQVAYDGPSGELDDDRLLRIYGDKVGQAKLELVA